MSNNNQAGLKKRVIEAADAALARQQYVSAIGVLCGMRLLAPSQAEAWRKGRIDFLELAIQGSLEKISSSMKLFRGWAIEKGLTPSETQYVRSTRAGSVDLRFSKSGDPAIEIAYRTHYVSPVLTERLKEKVSKAAPPVVFQILRDSECLGVRR